MGPKVRAATRFIHQGGKLAVITTAPLAAATLASADPADDRVGTRIVAPPGADIGLEYQGAAR
jgi:carbamate kinase